MRSTNSIRDARWLLMLLLCALPGILRAEIFELDNVTATISPSEPALTQSAYLVVEQYLCRDALELNAVASDMDSQTLFVSLAPVYSDFEIDPCPPGIRLSPLRVRLPQVMAAGTYTLNIYIEDSDIDYVFDPQRLEVTRELVVSALPLYWFETPAQGAVQSGVGLIRGWACEAETVQIQFDEQPLMDAGYGASRPDTLAICGDDNNGYGLAHAWGLLGDGEHRMKTYIDGEVVSDVGFEVVTLGEPFVTGLTGSFALQDFPLPGESVMLQWSEAAQNFIIVEHSGAAED